MVEAVRLVSVQLRGEIEDGASEGISEYRQRAQEPKDRACRLIDHKRSLDLGGPGRQQQQKLK